MPTHTHLQTTLSHYSPDAQTTISYVRDRITRLRCIKLRILSSRRLFLTLTTWQHLHPHLSATITPIMPLRGSNTGRGGRGGKATPRGRAPKNRGPSEGDTQGTGTGTNTLSQARSNSARLSSIPRSSAGRGLFPGQHSAIHLGQSQEESQFGQQDKSQFGQQDESQFVQQDKSQFGQGFGQELDQQDGFEDTQSEQQYPDPARIAGYNYSATLNQQNIDLQFTSPLIQRPNATRQQSSNTYTPSA